MEEHPHAHGEQRRRRGGAAPWEVGFPLAVFAAHWLLIQVAATLADRFGEANAPSPPYGQLPAPMGGLAGWVVEPLRQWDGLWYALIAETGYTGSTQSAKAAFWPLFPWLMEGGSRLTGWRPETVGYLLSNASFAVALVLLLRLVKLDFPATVARRTLIALAFFPTAFFFQAVYTESLFLVLVVGALLAARLGRWWVAGVVGALAALTRSYGVLLGLPFAVLLWQTYGSDLRRWFPAAIPAALPALGPILFGWHLERVQGNWRAFVDVQAQWNRYSALPWETMRCAFESCFALGGEPDGANWDWVRAAWSSPELVADNAWRVAAANSDTLELVGTLLFLGLAVVGLRVLPAWQSAYAIPGLLIPLFSPSEVHALMSMPRFGLTLFPLFVVLAALLRWKPLAVAALAVSTALLVLLTVQFAQWYWVS